jgi:hypothetical protein
MTNIKIRSFLPNKLFYIWLVGLLALCLGSNYLAKALPVKLIKNQTPFGITIDIISLCIIYYDTISYVDKQSN